jgi:WD40 repeat protein
MRVLSGHEAPVLCVAFSPDSSSLVSGDQDGTTILWDLESANRRDRWNPENGPVVALRFAPGGETLAIGYGWHVFLLELAYRLATPISRPLGGSAVLSFSPDGSRLLATGYLDRSVSIIDPDSGRVGSELQGHGGDVLAIAHSPAPDQSRRFATGGGASVGVTLHLWENNVVVRACYGHSLPVYSLAFSARGRFLASGSRDRTVRLWNPETAEELATLRGHTDTVVALGFTPDGRTLISAGADGVFKLWDVATQGLVRSFDFGIGRVRCVAISPDGLTAATGGTDHSVLLWDLD